MKYNVGIDYSMSSPALCLHPEGNFSFKKCIFYSLTEYEDLPNSKLINVSFSYPKIWKNHTDRFDKISDWAMRQLALYDIKKILLEGYAFSAKGVVFHIGENTGILKHKMMKKGYEVEIAPPTTIKKFATGKGNATKDMMVAAFLKETKLDLKALYQPKRKLGSPTTDLVDAYFLCSYVSQGCPQA